MPTTSTSKERTTRVAGKAAIPARGLAQMHRRPTHPGEIFRTEFRELDGVPRISQAEAARRMEMSTNRLNEIVAGKRGVTAETAVLIGALTDTDPRVWLHLQADYDLWHALRSTPASTLRRIVEARESVAAVSKA